MNPFKFVLRGFYLSYEKKYYIAIEIKKRVELMLKKSKYILSVFTL